MKRFIQVLFIILGIAGLLVLCLFYFEYKKKRESNQPALKSLPKHDSNEIFRVINRIRLRFENQKILYNPIIVSENGEEVTLKQLTNKNNKLIVFNFSEGSCDDCTIIELQKIKKIFYQDKNKVRILVLAKYSNTRHLTVFKKTHGLDFEIFRTKEGLLKELNMPFYFVLDSDFILKDLYVPAKEIPDLTTDYFNIILKKHFHEH